MSGLSWQVAQGKRFALGAPAYPRLLLCVHTQGSFIISSDIQKPISTPGSIMLE